MARGRICEPQIFQRQRDSSATTTTTTARLTSRDRINRLEKQLAQITASAGSGSTIASTTDGLDHNDQDEDEDEDVSLLDDIRVGTDPKGLEVPGASPPTHLSLLFDNALIGPKGQRRNGDGLHSRFPSTSTARCSDRYLTQVRSRLQRLVPAQEDVTLIAEYAAPWMTLYHGFFPALSFLGDPKLMLTKYDTIMAADAHPVAVAAFLTTLAITVRQLPLEESELRSQMLKDIPKFVREVVHAVQTTVIASNELAATIEGIQTTVLYLRL